MPQTDPNLPLVLAAIVDTPLRLRILEELPAHGWRVLTAGTGAEIAPLVALHGPDAMLVDPAMADQAGAAIRSLPLLRVLILPADQEETALTLMRALRINLSLAPPSNMEFLAATLDGVLRLTSLQETEAEVATQPREGEHSGTWTLSRKTWELTPPGRSPLRLTQSETTFLCALAESPGTPVSRPQMIAALGHNIDYYDSRRLDTMVSRLRLKVRKESDAAIPVRCIHSVGYAFVAPITLDDSA